MCKQCKPGEGSKLRVTLGQVGRRSILPLVAHSSFLPCFTRQGETQSRTQSVKGKSHVTCERSAPTLSLDLISAIASEASYEATFAPFRPPPQFLSGLWPKSHAAVAVRRINKNSILTNLPPQDGVSGFGIQLRLQALSSHLQVAGVLQQARESAPTEKAACLQGLWLCVWSREGAGGSHGLGSPGASISDPLQHTAGGAEDRATRGPLAPDPRDAVLPLPPGAGPAHLQRGVQASAAGDDGPDDQHNKELAAGADLHHSSSKPEPDGEPQSEAK